MVLFTQSTANHGVALYFDCDAEYHEPWIFA